MSSSIRPHSTYTIVTNDRFAKTGDQNGSPNCADNGGACGLTVSGYSAAVSQNLFGVGGGAGAGPACGTCWKLVSGSHEVTVTVNNLCPAGALNPLCSQSSLSDTNSEGANVNFDLCSDSGASAAFFGSGGGLLVGTATKVDCDGGSDSSNASSAGAASSYAESSYVASAAIESSSTASPSAESWYAASMYVESSYAPSEYAPSGTPEAMCQ